VCIFLIDKDQILGAHFGCYAKKEVIYKDSKAEEFEGLMGCTLHWYAHYTRKIKVGQSYFGQVLSYFPWPKYLWSKCQNPIL